MTPVAKILSFGGLRSPLPGSEAGQNLLRVRVEVPGGAPAVPISLLGPDGVPVSGVVRPGSTELEIPLCPGDACGLTPGATYMLAVGNLRLPDEFFVVAPCARLDPPRLRDLQVEARDRSATATIRLDSPAFVRLQAGPARTDGGDLCENGCAEATGLVACTPSACDPSAPDPVPPCERTLELTGLAPGLTYDVRATLEDDYGHRSVALAAPFRTLAVLPQVELSEVMASPPPALSPGPRSWLQ